MLCAGNRPKGEVARAGATTTVVGHFPRGLAATTRTSESTVSGHRDQVQEEAGPGERNLAT